MRRSKTTNAKLYHARRPKNSPKKAEKEDKNRTTTTKDLASTKATFKQVTQQESPAKPRKRTRTRNNASRVKSPSQTFKNVFTRAHLTGLQRKFSMGEDSPKGIEKEISSSHKIPKLGSKLSQQKSRSQMGKLAQSASHFWMNSAVHSKDVDRRRAKVHTSHKMRQLYRYIARKGKGKPSRPGSLKIESSVNSMEDWLIMKRHGNQLVQLIKIFLQFLKLWLFLDFSILAILGIYRVYDA